MGSIRKTIGAVRKPAPAPTAEEIIASAKDPNAPVLGGGLLSASRKTYFDGQVRPSSFTGKYVPDPITAIPDPEDLQRSRRKQLSKKFAVGGRAGTILTGPTLGGNTDPLGG